MCKYAILSSASVAMFPLIILVGSLMYGRRGGHVERMPHRYNRIKLSIPAVNLMKMKSLIRNRTIIKCLYSMKNAFLIFLLCSAVPFCFSIL